MNENYKITNKSLFDVEINGQIIFIYSNKREIYFFIEDYDTNSLFKVTTDKYFYIEYIEKIDIPEEYFEHELIKFYKPLEKQDDIIYVGITKYKEKAYKFNITNKLKLEYIEEIDYVDIPQIVEEYEELKDFYFINFIKNKNIIYGVAYDTEYDIDCFIKFNIDKKCISKCYSLFSDEFDIYLKTINIDLYENKVYIAGYKKNIQTKEITPYFEFLSL